MSGRYTYQRIELPDQSSDRNTCIIVWDIIYSYYYPTSVFASERDDMRIGVIFPQTEIGNDPAVIRDFAQTAEDLGYSHVLVYDHVLGANPERPGG